MTVRFKHTIMRQALLISFLFIKGIALFSQSNPSYTVFSGYVEGAPLLSSGITGFDINLTQTAKANHTGTTPILREKNRSAKLYMKLDLGDEYVKSANSAWNFKIKADVTYSFGGGTGITKNISISDKNPEIMWVEDVSPQFASSSPACNVHVQITEYGNGATPTVALSGLVADFVSSKLRLKAQLVREYDVDVRLDATGLLSNAPIINAPVITNRFAEFSWQPNISAPNNFYPNYQVQILKLYNTNPLVTDNVNNISAKPDWSKALTVETQSYKHSLKLTIAEGSGFYLWRVRPIGTYYAGGIANSENYGEWSYCDSTQMTLQKSTLITANHPLPFAFYVTDPDENLNWIYNRIFTEGDDYDKADPTGAKVSEGMSYADGLQRVRQNQKFNSAENTNITSQTINDYSGRPALTTIPVPTKGGLNGYKPDFVKAAPTQLLYTAADFDTDASLTNPALIADGPSSSFAYYSNNPSTLSDVDNTNVPDAEGYAFKRTFYKADGTNRVEEESGVGKTHSLGQQTNGQGRTTRIIYGVPSDDELIQIFGLEAPLAESVIKTTTIDQNNVISVSYTSKEGKTIATALTSSVSPNLEALGSARTLTVSNAANKNVNAFGKIIASKRISIANDNTTLKLGYTMTLPGTAGECLSGNCNYRLKIYMVDVKNNRTYVSDADVNLAGISHFTTGGSTLDFNAFDWNFVSVFNNGVNTTTTTMAPGGTDNNELLLHSGEYVFIKELYSANSSNYADSLANVAGDKVKLILDVLAKKMQDITDDQKRIAFETFMDDFKTKVTNYNSNPASEDVWAFLGVTDPDRGSFPLQNEFNLAALAPSGETGSSNLQITTKCCGPLTVQIPGAGVCVVCDGATTTDDILIPSRQDMSSANSNAGTLVTPYGLKDFEATDGWKDLTIADKRAAINSLVEREFIDMLKNKMEEESISAEKELWLIAPGFSYESLNFMISNMLLSQYYSGSSIAAKLTSYSYTVDTNGEYLVDANAVENTNHIQGNYYPHNYDCKKLIESWTAAVELLNTFELDGNDNNVLKEYDNSEGPGAALNQFLDVDNWPPALKTTITAMETIISNLINKFKNSKAGSVPDNKISALTSITSNFMDFAGYQFAGIIDGQPLPLNISIDNQTEPDDYSDYSYSPGPNDPAVIYTTASIGSINYPYVPVVFDISSGNPVVSTCNSINNGNTNYYELYYPYVLKPEWMFKYYVYNVYNDAVISDDELLIPHQVMVDVAQNYNEPYTYVGYSGSSSDLCYLPVTNTISGSSEVFSYTHYNWSSSERTNFYQLIQAAPACPAEKGIDGPGSPTSGEIYAGGTLPECQTKDVLIAEAVSILNNAVETMNNKAGEIKDALITELTDACWNIVSCRSVATNEITNADIDIMVKAVIDKCVNYQINPIISTFTNIPSTGNPGCSSIGSVVMDYSESSCNLPVCTTSDCKEIVYYDDNTLGLIQNRKLAVTYFKECDQKLLDMFLTGTFLPHLPSPPTPENPPCTRTPKVFNQCDPDLDCDPNNPDGYGETPSCAPSQYKTYSKHYEVTAQRGQ